MCTTVHSDNTVKYGGCRCKTNSVFRKKMITFKILINRWERGHCIRVCSGLIGKFVVEFAGMLLKVGHATESVEAKIKSV